jgi:hypothetical protein
VALFDVADCFTRAVRLLARPTADEAFTDVTTGDVLYGILDDAQRDIATRIAWQIPDVAYEPPTQLTTADSGVTYTFGLDADGNPIIPLGQIELRGNGARGVPILPGNDWADTTDVYLMDTDPNTGAGVVRWPGQRSRTFSNGLWARYVKPCRQITSASSTVTLKPYVARQLIPPKAAEIAAIRLMQDPAPFAARYEELWGLVLAALKTQQHGQGLRALDGASGVWWRNGDLGRSGY